MAREGAEVAVREGAEGAATTTTRRWMAGQGWRGGQELIESRWWSRGLQNGIEGGLEGAFDGFLIGAWQQGFDERTWENGVLAGIVRLGESGYQHAVMGGMVGGVMAPGFDIMMRGGAGAISMIPGGRPPNGGPRGGIRGWADSFGESFVDRAAAGEVGDQTRFVSELGLDASSQRLRTASEVQTRARQRLKEAENAGEVLTGRERAQLEREANAVQRTTQALEGANVSAEIRRRPSQDGRGGEVTLAYREVQTDLNIARAERRAQFLQAFRELVRLDNGVLGRFREAGARVVGALRDTGNIWRLAADGRAYRREIGIQGAVTDRMARSVDPGNPELRTHTEASVRAASNTWDALRHGNVVRAFQEFRNWQRGTRARVGLSQQLEVDIQLTARRDQITAARDAAGAESFNPALVQYLDNVADRATRRLREGLEIVSRRREAWSNFFSLQGFPPVLQIFNGSRVRRALRDSSNAERHLVDALSSNDRLARSLHETASVPNAAPAVVEAHVARLEARAAAREGRAAVGNFVGDTLRLRPVSAVRDLFEAGRSVFSYLGPRRDLRRLLPVVDEARFTTRAVRAVETPDMAVQARRYGITRARLQNSLRAFTDPLGTARDFLQNGYARAGNLLGFDAGTPRPVRNPFGVLTDGVRAYRQSRGLQRAEREAVLARVERTSTDTARERIFGRLGRDERFSGIAVDLAEANLSRRVAFQRFRNSLRDVRDRLLAGGNGDTRSIGEVFSAVRESFGTFQSTRRDRARAFDRYLVARRQISYEGRGMGSPEALRRARQEILARRRVTRFDASDANVLIRERFGDVANSVSTTARSVSSSVRTVSEEVADRLQRLNPLQLARDGVHTLHSVTERVRTRLGQQIDGLTGSISDILSSRRRLGVLYAFERAQQLVERIGIRLPGREGRDRMVQGIRDTLRESRERLRDLAEERGLARAQQYIGTALDVGDQIVDATGRGFQRNLSAVERFAEADVVLSLTSGWNPLQWVSRFRASRNLGSARRELFEYRSFVEREAFVITRTQELLSTLGRRELAPGLRRDKSVLELAEQLARAEGLARQQNQLFDHELFGRLNMFELPRWSRMGRYSREAGEAAQLQRELEDRFYSEIRIEQEAARLHRAAGGRDDALQASVALADAREGVRFRRGTELDDHVRAGGDPSTFNRAQYDEALARAQFDYSLAFLRSGKDHYQALVREAEALAENVGDYVERITSRNTPWGKWLEQRSITRRLRNLSRVADSDVRLSVDIENNPYVLRSAEGPTTVLDRTTVDPVRYITEVRDSVRRQREQYRTQLEEFQTRGTEVMDALSDTRVGREGNGLELRIVRDEPEVPTRRRAEAEESDELAPIIDFYDSGPRFSPSDPKPRRTLRDRGDGGGLRQPTPPQTSLASTGSRATPVGAPESPLAMRPLPEAGDVPTPDALRQLRDDSVGFIGLSEDGAALRRELSPDELPGGSTLRLVRDEPLINFYDFKPRPVEAALRPTRTTPEADSIAPVAPPETAIPVAPREGAVARVPDAEIPVRPIPEPSSIGTPDSPLRLRDDVVDLHLADAVPNRTPKPDEEIEIVDFKPSETSPTALSETDGLVNRLKKKAAVWVMTFASMFPQPSTAMSDVASLLDSAPVASWLDINMNSGMMRNRLELQDAAPQTVRSAEVVTPGRHVEVDVDVHREIEVDVDVHRVAEVDTQRVTEWDATTHRASEMLVRHEVQISNRAAVAPCYIENHSVARAVQESTYRAVEVEESAAKARESDSPRNPRRPRRPRFRPGGDYFGEGGEFDEYVFSDPKKDGRRFGVYATDFSSYQGKGVMDLQLRKRQVDKVKEYIGMTELEFEKVKYSEPLY
ncbi:MAG: hypothetical protein KDD70_08530 [Bdellovibrionales bacterium]|nr:hypothetical protein [Bdellovibrionales bacterium]